MSDQSAIPYQQPSVSAEPERDQSESESGFEPLPVKPQELPTQLGYYSSSNSSPIHNLSSESHHSFISPLTPFHTNSSLSTTSTSSHPSCSFFANPITPLDHRLDIQPSPSPPQFTTHLPDHQIHPFPHIDHHQPKKQLTAFVTNPVTTNEYYLDAQYKLTYQSYPFSTSQNFIINPILTRHPIDSDISFQNQQMSPLPPPPKKRERMSASDTSGSANNSSDAPKTLKSNIRPAKKEKPAPVTIIYRGAPDRPYHHSPDNTMAYPNPSVTALPPQTAIHRGLASTAIDIAPPSTIAPSYSLSHATETSLMKKKHNRLRDLCRERDLLDPSRELTKREMVQTLLVWRQENSCSNNFAGFSEAEDSVMSSASGYDTDDYQSRSFSDSIDPQLISPDVNPGIYNLRPRRHFEEQQQPDHQETIRGSAKPGTRMAIPTPFSPQSQLANYLAATGLQNDPHGVPLDPSITSPPAATPRDSPMDAATPSIVSHPPMIPLLDDPARNNKRRSIRLVGTKVPSIGPIGKISASNINVGGGGPMSISEPKTMKGAPSPLTALAPNGTVRMKSSSPPSPPTSTETEGEEGQSDCHQASAPDDIDVLLDLEDLKLSDKEIPPEKLAREHKVGSGSFKDVYMGRYRNFRVAICDLRGRLTDMDIKELGLLRDLRHPNIVRFIGVSVGGAVPCTIVTELCRNGDLYDYIRKIPCPPYVQILAMMLDAARGVEYLHMRTPSIIHRDLKSPNVLITSSGSAKITDFGLARVKRDVMSMCATTCGTLNWQAPELWVAHPSYNHSIDVYALGLVFWEVLCWPFKEKTYPFQGMNEHAIFDEVGKKRHRPSTSMIRRKWGRDIVALIERMWDGDSDARPAMPEVTRILNAMLLQEREKSWAASNSPA